MPNFVTPVYKPRVAVHCLKCKTNVAMPASQLNTYIAQHSHPLRQQSMEAHHNSGHVSGVGDDIQTRVYLDIPANNF